MNKMCRFIRLDVKGGNKYRATMCRIGMWFLERAELEIVSWEEVK